MKHIILVFIISLLLIQCSNNGSMQEQAVRLPAEPLPLKQYAVQNAAVYGDIELKKKLTSVEKTEGVFILEKLTAERHGAGSVEVSKVRLADDQVGYIESSLLAGEPVTFTNSAVLRLRPDPGSRVTGNALKGSVAFLLQSDVHVYGWVKLHVGLSAGRKSIVAWTESSNIKGLHRNPSEITL